MRLIIAGVRKDYRIDEGDDTFMDYDMVVKAINIALPFFGDPEITEEISGVAMGVDKLGERWWQETTGQRPKRFFPDYRAYGKIAPLYRNQTMADYAAEKDGGLIAIWDGQSRGTRDMIERAELAGLKMYVHKF